MAETGLTKRDREALELCRDAAEVARAYHTHPDPCIELAIKMGEKLRQAEKHQDRTPLRLSEKDRRTEERSYRAAMRLKRPKPWFMLVVRLAGILRGMELLEYEE